jgi:hypothetical protein
MRISREMLRLLLNSRVSIDEVRISGSPIDLLLEDLIDLLLVLKNAIQADLKKSASFEDIFFLPNSQDALGNELSFHFSSPMFLVGSLNVEDVLKDLQQIISWSLALRNEKLERVLDLGRKTSYTFLEMLDFLDRKLVQKASITRNIDGTNRRLKRQLNKAHKRIKKLTLQKAISAQTESDVMSDSISSSINHES